jgi:WD40 repeat protein
MAVGSGEPRADLKGTVGLWNKSGWVEKRRWPDDGGMVGSVAFSPDGKVLTTGRSNGVVEIRPAAADDGKKTDAAPRQAQPKQCIKSPSCGG